MSTNDLQGRGESEREPADVIRIYPGQGDYDWVASRARELGRHWDADSTPADFAEFVANVVLSDLNGDLHSRKSLIRWEQRIRRDERRRLGCKCRAPRKATP
jgi:hypothetical protein